MGLEKFMRMLNRLSLRAWRSRDDSDLRREFDAAFYLERNPHVARSRIDPLRHYLEAGWKEGADPAPWFSSTAYLAAYEDARGAGVNPFAHYIRHGRREGRAAGVRPAAPFPQRGGHDTAKATPDPTEVASIAETIAPHFDAGYYLAVNPDVAESGADPVRHYVSEGWREGRDPSRNFSTRYYLETNSDVSAQGLNPFWHYVVAGMEENRLPAEPGGYKARILRSARALERTVEAWRWQPREIAPVDREVLTAALRRTIPRRPGRLVVSFTHDNHRKVVGGVQLCTSREEAAALEAGHCYLSLHPWQPLPCLAAPEGAPGLAVGLMLNGIFLGTAPIGEVTAAIAEARPTGTAVSLVVHSLLGHAPEAVVAMARALAPTDAWFWLHDNFSICPSYALLRNDITYCGAPPPDSPACGICLYGEERRRHLPRIRALLGDVDFTLVAPSESERDLWTARSGLTASRIVVLPHVSLDRSGARGPRRADDGAPVRVAFAGIASTIKGWPVFQALAERFAGTRDYTFHYFGVSETNAPTVAATRVSASGERPAAMRDALMAEEIDLLVHWSACPETFSFTAHEALAAGAAVVTHEGTGNVAALVRETGRGRVVEDEEALLALFADGEARRLAKANRRTARPGGSLVLSRMTIDLIEGRHADGDPLLHELHV